jgi:hypothetical protein
LLCNNIANEVISDIDVLRAGMEFIILGYRDGGLVITIDGDRAGKWTSDLSDNMHIHCASFAAWVAAMYSASVVDRATIGCFFELHEMAPPSIVKM